MSNNRYSTRIRHGITQAGRERERFASLQLVGQRSDAYRSEESPFQVG